MQLVRPPGVCGKVLSKKIDYKSVETSLLLTWPTNIAVCLQTNFSSPLWALIGVLAKFNE